MAKSAGPKGMLQGKMPITDKNIGKNYVKWRGKKEYIKTEIQSSARNARHIENRQKFGNRAYRKLCRHLKVDIANHPPRPEGLLETPSFMPIKITPRPKVIGHASRPNSKMVGKRPHFAHRSKEGMRV